MTHDHPFTPEQDAELVRALARAKLERVRDVQWQPFSDVGPTASHVVVSADASWTRFRERMLAQGIDPNDVMLGEPLPPHVRAALDRDWRRRFVRNVAFTGAIALVGGLVSVLVRWVLL